MKGTPLTTHTPEKVTLYLDFITLFVNLLSNPKKWAKGLDSMMLNVGLNMMILAPDPVAKAFIFWKALAADTASTTGTAETEATIDALGVLIIEMRKDLVGETTCVRDDAVGMFLRDQI